MIEIIVTFIPTTGNNVALAVLDENLYVKRYLRKPESFSKGISGCCFDDKNNFYFSSDDNVHLFNLDDLHIVRTYKEHNGNFHGLNFIPNYGVAIAATRNDSVFLLQETDYKRLHNHTNKDKDTVHLNSVSHVEGDNILITIHNRDKPGFVYKHNLKTHESVTIKEDLNQPHDFKFFDGILYGCDSKNETVIKEGFWVSNVKGYSRGLDVFEGRVYVGVSRRNANYTSFFVLDDETGDIVKSRHFNKKVFGNEIYSVLVRKVLT